MIHNGGRYAWKEMKEITYIDRVTGKEEVETVYGAAALQFLYGPSKISKMLGRTLFRYLFKYPICSALYGWWQKQPLTAKKIVPFINAFSIDSSEFESSPHQFKSFNNFFIRKLKGDSRPICPDPHRAIIPADGRYRVFPNLSKAEGFVVKGEKFILEELLQSPALAEEYAEGVLVIARLCPSDYHRFYFPCE